VAHHLFTQVGERPSMKNYHVKNMRKYVAVTVFLNTSPVEWVVNSGCLWSTESNVHGKKWMDLDAAWKMHLLWSKVGILISCGLM